MKIGLIGFGQAGGKIADQLVEFDQKTNSNIIVDTLAVNTARADLKGLENIPEEKRILIGQEQVKGHGVGADNELGAEIAELDMYEIQNAIDSFSTHKIEAFLIVTALGGGTGSGGSPVLAEKLKTIYTEPVYGVGIFPSKSEGSIYSLNAARSFQTLIDEVDSLIVFDNETWQNTGESMKSGYQYMNQELVQRLGTLFSAGEVTGDNTDVGESIVDSSEIINTLGNRGLSSIGYASEPVTSQSSGIVSQVFGSNESEDKGEKVNRMTSLTRKAALSRLTLDCQLDGVERSLVLFAGPPDKLSRKGLERSRKWIEDETKSSEVRGGDYPLPGENKIASVVLLSGITNSERVKELQGIAVQAQENINDLEDESEQKLNELIQTEDDELDDLL